MNLTDAAQNRVLALTEAMRLAVAAEDYESASNLRDEIASIVSGAHVPEPVPEPEPEPTTPPPDGFAPFSLVRSPMITPSIPSGGVNPDCGCPAIWANGDHHQTCANFDPEHHAGIINRELDECEAVLKKVVQNLSELRRVANSHANKDGDEQMWYACVDYAVLQTVTMISVAHNGIANSVEVYRTLRHLSDVAVLNKVMNIGFSLVSEHGKHANVAYKMALAIVTGGGDE